MAASVAVIAALNPRGANIFFPIDIAGFINFHKKIINNLPKFPPSFIISFICTLLNFMSVDMLFSIFPLIYLIVVQSNTIHELIHFY